jgi:hypothetical protein
MTFERLQHRAVAAGHRAADAAAARIAARANVPPDVTIIKDGSDVIITAKHLRVRVITDPALRNFAHE